MIKNYKILTITHRNTNLSELGKFVVPYSEEQELQSRSPSIERSIQFGRIAIFGYLQPGDVFFSRTNQNIDFGFIFRFFPKSKPLSF